MYETLIDALNHIYGNDRREWPITRSEFDCDPNYSPDRSYYLTISDALSLLKEHDIDIPEEIINALDGSDMTLDNIIDKYSWKGDCNEFLNAIRRFTKEECGHAGISSHGNNPVCFISLGDDYEIPFGDAFSIKLNPEVLKIRIYSPIHINLTDQVRWNLHYPITWIMCNLCKIIESWKMDYDGKYMIMGKGEVHYCDDEESAKEYAGWIYRYNEEYHRYLIDERVTGGVLANDVKQVKQFIDLSAIHPSMNLW